MMSFPAAFPAVRVTFVLPGCSALLPLVLLFKNPSFYRNNAKGGAAETIALLLYNKDLVKSRKSFGALFSSSEDADEGRLLITAIHYLFTGS